MKKPFALLSLLAILTAPALADTPSDSEIRQLLEVMQVEHNLAQMRAPILAAMQNQVSESFKGRPLNPAQQAVLEQRSKDMSTVTMEEISWKKMPPIIARIYRESYSSEGIKGMLQFFQSSVGQAMTAKQPVVAQKTLEAMQPITANMRPKLNILIMTAIQKFTAAGQPRSAN